MSFKLSELEDLFKNIENVLNQYEESRYANKFNTMYLANGEQVYYSIRKDSVAHLLGINTTYLISTGLYKEKSSYDLLKAMLENPYKIYSNESKGIIKYDSLFSKHIYKKVDSFLNNIKLNVLEIEFVCSYNKERSYHLEDKIENCDYIVVRKYKNGSIGVLTFVKNESYYQPMSNRIYDDFESSREDLKHMLNNQVITIVTGISFDNACRENASKFYLYSKDQMPKIENLKYYSNEFNCIPNTISQHIYSLKYQNKNYADKIDENSLIDYIADSILQGKPIETDNEDTRFIKIINAYNDHLFSYSIEDGQETYTEQRKKIKKLEEQISELTELKNQLISTNEYILNENTMLKSENEEKSNQLTKILEILKPSE